MKKVVFAFLLLGVYYVAGMYGSPALMVLFLTQLLLMTVMFFLAMYLKRSLTVTFAETLLFAEKGQTLVWNLKTWNKGRLPVSRFAVRFRIRSPGTGRGTRKKIYGDSDCGEGMLSARYLPGHCGKLIFQAEKVRVYDYLSLFSGRKHLKDQMEVLVFPQRCVMKIHMEAGLPENEVSVDRNSFAAGNDYGEIRQIREYRPGDSVRHIHWNQTARSGQLWVKEYQEESGSRMHLFLDLREAPECSPAEMDAFYTALYALLSGLLECMAAVHVFWNEAEGMSEAEIRDDAGCRELFARLYDCVGRGISGNSSQPGAEPENTMRLTVGLSLYAGNRLIRRFSRENLQEELAQEVFITAWQD